MKCVDNLLVSWAKFGVGVTILLGLNGWLLGCFFEIRNCWLSAKEWPMLKISRGRQSE